MWSPPPKYFPGHSVFSELHLQSSCSSNLCIEYLYIWKCTEKSELSSGIKLFLSEMGGCCIRTFSVHHRSEEVMNISWAESVGRCRSAIFLFSERPPFWHETECVNLGLSEMKWNTHNTPCSPPVLPWRLCDSVTTSGMIR